MPKSEQQDRPPYPTPPEPSPQHPQEKPQSQEQALDFQELVAYFEALPQLIHTHLGRYELYLPNHNVVQAVQGRLDAISGDPTHKVVIIHDDQPDAFAYQNCIVISDTLLKILPNQEALDFLLAHEHSHLLERSELRYRTKLFEKLGTVRAGEFLADITPLEHLSERGINPAGYLDLTRTFEEYLVQHSPSKKDQTRFDIEHGSLQDRRSTISEFLFLINVESLSHTRTPKPFDDAELTGYISREQMEQSWDTLTKHQKEHLLRYYNEGHHLLSQRHLQTAPEEEVLLTPEEEAEDVIKRTKPTTSALELAKKRVLEVDRSLEPSEQDSVAKIIWYTYNPGEIYFIPSPEARLTTKELQNIIQLFANFNWSALGLTPNPEALVPFLFSWYITNNPRLEAYAGVIKELRSSTQLDVMGWHAPLIVLRNNNITLGQTAQYLLNQVGFGCEDINYISNAFGIGELQQNHNTQIRIVANEFASLLLRQETNTPVAKATQLARFLSGGDAHNQESQLLVTHLSDPSSLVTGLLQLKTANKKLFVEAQEMIFGYITADQTVLADWVHQTPAQNAADLGRVALLYLVIAPTKSDFIKLISDYLRESELLTTTFRDSDDTSTTPWIDSLLAAYDTLATRGHEMQWRLTRTDLSAIQPLCEEGRAHMLSHLARSEVSATEKAKLLLAELSELSFSSYRFTDTEEQHNWNTLAMELLATLPEQKADYTYSDWLAVFALCLFSDSVLLTAQVAPHALKQAVSLSDFETGHSLIRQFSHLPKTVLLPALMELSEHKKLTHQQRELIDVFVSSELSAILADHEKVGLLSAVDVLMNVGVGSSGREWQVANQEYSLQQLDPHELLSALLMTHETDRPLSEMLFERWLTLNQTATNDDTKRAFNLSAVASFGLSLDPASEPKSPAIQEGSYVNLLPNDSHYVPFEDVMRQLYLLEKPMKVALLRKLLLGEQGLLTTEVGKKALLDLFLGRLLDTNDSGPAQEKLRTLLTQVLVVGDPEILFSRIAPFLADYILIPPSQQNYRQLYVIAAGKVVDKAKPAPPVTGQKEVDQKTLQVWQRNVSLVLRKVTVLAQGKPAKRSVASIQQTSQSLVETLLATTTTQSPENKQRQSAWELTLSLARGIGAEAVRAVQWSPLYFPLSQESRSDIAGVYDQNPGQTALQMYRLLKRISKKNPTVKTLFDTIEFFEPKVGGGSLFSVFRTTLKGGEARALGVQNPNAEYLLEEMHQIFIDALSRAAQEDPVEAEFYHALLLLLIDIKQSLLDELHDETFYQKDERFHAGVTTTSPSGMRQGKASTHIKVPRANDTQTELVRDEEFIPGANLTRISIDHQESRKEARELLLTPDQYQEKASLLVRSFLHQLLELRLVHPDLSAGNVRLSPELDIYLLDRRNLLELSDADVQLVKATLAALSKNKPPTDALLSYVMALPENTQLVATATVQTKIRGALESVVSQSTEQTFFAQMMVLRKAGFILPVTITLIAKNVLFLQQLITDAGFADFKQAIEHTATLPERIKLGTRLGAFW